ESGRGRAPIRSQDTGETPPLEMARGLRQLAPSARKNFRSPRQRRKTGHSPGQSGHARNRDDQPYNAPLLPADTTGRSGAGASPYHGGVSIYTARRGSLHERRWSENGHGRR